GARRHAHAERFGEAGERVFGNAQRFQAGIGDGDAEPGIRRDAPTGGGVDVRRQAAEKGPAGRRIVDTKQHVRADIRCGPCAEHRRLNLVQLECRYGATLADGVVNRHGDHRVLPYYATLSSSSSTAWPIFSSLRVSAAVRFGLLTYQASAAI